MKSATDYLPSDVLQPFAPVQPRDTDCLVSEVDTEDTDSTPTRPLRIGGFVFLESDFQNFFS